MKVSNVFSNEQRNTFIMKFQNLMAPSIIDLFCDAEMELGHMVGQII